MNCLVTAGPTWEPLDQVRRMTNFSTGRLGIELANALAQAQHRVTLLLGELATCTVPIHATEVRRFSTTEDLEQQLVRCARESFDAVFHAAAVSDFRPSRIWHLDAAGRSHPVSAGKIPTHLGPLWVEMVPTPKLIRRLRDWFPMAWLVGWKYVVDGTRQDAFQAARAQMAECRTDVCVVNGPAYGDGFALLQGDQPPVHVSDQAALCAELVRRCAHAHSAR
jgi:phosphopantothenoylcysteine synthetase/decarboxylase